MLVSVYFAIKYKGVMHPALDATSPFIVFCRLNFEENKTHSFF